MTSCRRGSPGTRSRPIGRAWKRPASTRRRSMRSTPTRRPRSPRASRRRAARPSPIPPSWRPRSGPTEARRGGTDLSRGRGRRDRAGDGARPVRRAAGRGRRRGRRRVQADRGPVRPVRARARPRHADQRAGDRRGGDGRGDDRAATGRGAHVQRLLRRDLGHGRQPDRQDPLHDRRPGLAAARDPHGERRRAPVRRPAQPGDRELGDGDPGAQGRRAVDPGGRPRPDGGRRSATRTR